eukprot:166205-Prorocentrum_minimum.AAC.1
MELTPLPPLFRARNLQRCGRTSLGSGWTRSCCASARSASGSGGSAASGANGTSPSRSGGGREG